MKNAILGYRLQVIGYMPSSVRHYSIREIKQSAKRFRVAHPERDCAATRREIAQGIELVLDSVPDEHRIQKVKEVRNQALGTICCM